MATETTTGGNLAQVREAFTPSEPISVREQQRYPFKGWYAVIVRSSREQDAADGFRRESVSAYWPNYTRQISASRGRRRQVFAPIFPGLIFCPLADLEPFWQAIQRIPYVLNMLRKDGGVPATLTNADIETIRRIESVENEPPAVKPLHNFKTGQKVRFADEVQCSWPPGRIARLSDNGRIGVEVYLMGRMVLMSVLPHQIEPS